MITFARTGDFQDGKQPAAMAWAIKVTDYLNEVLGLNIQVMVNVGGKVNQLHWVGTFDTLAAYDEAMEKIAADQGYMELFAEAAAQALFRANSIRDNLFRTVG
jgi:hypothetical protein